MKKIVLFLCILLMFVSCGKKEVKKESHESRIAKEAFALAETVKNAFLENDRTSLKEHATEEGYRDILANEKVFDSVELSFNPRWVEIENLKVYLNIAWTSTWTTSGRKVEERGMAVFVMDGRPLKVEKILRANPFIYPEQ